MAGCIVLGVAAIRRRVTAGYRAWMARGHAIGPGACTCVPTSLPWALLVGQPSGRPRVLLVLAVTPVADRVG